MKEIWKPIKGFEKRYHISNLGRLKALKREKGLVGVNHRYCIERILTGLKVKGRYVNIQLWKKGKFTAKNIHRLVLETFKPTNIPKLETNHIDGDKYNNRLDNLEWVTSKENKAHAFKTGLCNHRRGEGLYNSKLTEKAVKWIRENHKQYTYSELTKKFSVGKSCICGIVHRKAWKHI